MTAGRAPVDTSCEFLPTLMSVMRKSTAMFEGTTSRSGRKMTWGWTLMFAELLPATEVLPRPRAY